MSQKIVTYDNHQYQSLEIEETATGSGRYKILHRESKTVYGVLDDEAVRNETESLVKDYTSSLKAESMIMVLSTEDGKIYEVLSTLFALHASNYDSCFEAILDIIKKNGIVKSKPYLSDNKIYFEMELPDESQTMMTLQGYTSQVIVVKT